METRVVLYDACVLYPAPLRSFLMYLALTELFQARWTDEIHEEWMRNVQKDYPDISRDKVERVRDLMNGNVEGCLVTGYEPHIPTITLSDPNDRHVLAAAIHCQADVILTINLRDFPEVALQPYKLKAQHPDAFIANLLTIAPDVVCGAARRQRESLKNPPKSADEFLAILERQGLLNTVAQLRLLADQI